MWWLQSGSYAAMTTYQTVPITSIFMSFKTNDMNGMLVYKPGNVRYPLELINLEKVNTWCSDYFRSRNFRVFRFFRESLFLKIYISFIAKVFSPPKKLFLVFAKVFSAKYVPKTTIRESFCKKFRVFLDTRNFLPAKLSAPKVNILFSNRKKQIQHKNHVTHCFFV